MRVNRESRKKLPVSLRIERQGDQEDQQGGDDEIAQAWRPDHLFAAGNRPSGRTTSTTAIMR